MSDRMRVCEIFAGARRPGSYLFVDQEEGFARVPSALLEAFGETRSVLTLKLHENRVLAQANAVDVLNAIDAEGFYLQLPPAEDSAAPADDQLSAHKPDDANGDPC